MVIEAMDVPNKREIVKRLRSAMGIQGPDGQPVDPAVAQAQQQMQELQAQVQAGAQQYEQTIAELTQQLNVAEVKLANKADEIQIKEREVGIKETQVAVDAASAGVDPAEVQAMVSQAIAPLVEQISALLAGPLPVQQQNQIQRSA